MKRSRMSRRSSQKQFRRGAQRMHSKNRWDALSMRGGIRL